MLCPRRRDHRAAFFFFCGSDGRWSNLSRHSCHGIGRWFQCTCQALGISRCLRLHTTGGIRHAMPNGYRQRNTMGWCNCRRRDPWVAHVSNDDRLAVAGDLFNHLRDAADQATKNLTGSKIQVANRCTGQSIVMRAPPSGDSPIKASPACHCATRLTIASPSPVPPESRLRL